MATEHRLDYKGAAAALGISTDAVRMRVRRGTLRSERDQDGVRVILDADQVVPVETNDLVSVLREQLAEEREARRRADTIILNLTQANASLAQRVPALQAAAEERPDVPASHDAPSGGVLGYRIVKRGPADAILVGLVSPVIPIILPRGRFDPLRWRLSGLSASTRTHNHSHPLDVVSGPRPRSA